MYTCKKCKSEIEDHDRYCFYCGSYTGEPVSVKDNWETLNSGVNAYLGSSIVELSEKSLLNNIVLRTFLNPGNNVIKSLLILIKSPARGINSLFETFSKNFIITLTFLIIVIQSIIVFFVLKKLEAYGAVAQIYNFSFITFVNLFLGLMFCSIIVSSSAYLIVYYVFKIKGELIKLWNISIISTIGLLGGICIILILKVFSILVSLFLLIGFMISLISMVTSIKISLKINEDKITYLTIFIYLIFIGSAFLYYSFFLI